MNDPRQSPRVTGAQRGPTADAGGWSQPPDGSGAQRGPTAGASGWTEPPRSEAQVQAQVPPGGAVGATSVSEPSAFAPPAWGVREVLLGVLAIVLLIIGVLAAIAAPYRGDIDVGSVDFGSYDAVDWLIVLALVVLACNVAIFAWLLLRYTSGTGPQMMAVTVGALVVVAAAPLLAPDGISDDVAELIVPSLALYGLSVYVALLIAANRDALREAIGRLGLTLPEKRSAYLEALGLYGAAFLGVTVWALLTEISGAPEWVQIPDNASDIIDDYGVVTTLIVVVLIAPFGEEIVFRGFAYAGLTKRLRPVGAAVGTSLVFAVIHLDPTADVGVGIIPPTFILGVALVAIYHRTGSLLLSIGAHALHNGIAVAALSVG